MKSYNLCFSENSFVCDDIKNHLKEIIGSSMSDNSDNNYTIYFNPLNIYKNETSLNIKQSLYDYIFDFFPKTNQTIFPMNKHYSEIVINYIEKLHLDNIIESEKITVFSDEDVYTFNENVTLFTLNENIKIDNPSKYDKIYIIGYDINPSLKKENNVELIDLSDFIAQFIYKDFYKIG